MKGRGRAAMAILAISAVMLAIFVIVLAAGCGGSTRGGAGTTGGTTSPPASTAPGETTTGGSPAGGAEVVMKGIKFVPDSLTVKVGQTVTWLNQDNTDHDIVAVQGEFKSGLFGQGKSFSFTFAKAGTYAYYCSVHPNMKGTIIVQ
jgi:plastocyanin